MKGNKETLSSLENILQNPSNVPEAFLFTGPTGVGKTTAARIVAKELGSDENNRHEIDTADLRGIDTVREIHRQVRYKPIGGATCRIYIIDECHKMTNDAQNALLKLLENPPAHVHFILCTTEPNKLISTIRGRCAHYHFDTLDDRDMTRLLRNVVKAEEEEIDRSLYELISRESLGHPRNALQILQRVLAAKPEEREQIAKQAAEEESQTIELCRALLNKKSWNETSKILRGLEKQDPEGIRRQVLGYMAAVLKKTDKPQAGAVMEEFIEPFYNTGFPGLVFACYYVIKS